MTCSRRSLIELFALAVAGCATPQPPSLPAPTAPPDVRVNRLSDLLTVVGLDWVLLLSPATLWATSWLTPSLGRIIQDERLDLVAKSTGIDLRHVGELALARYGGGEAVIYMVRHALPAIEVERRFRERLTSDARRVVHGHQLVTVWGKVGTAERGLSSIGPEVAAFQYEGERRKGPLAIAMLYALGELEEIPTIFDDPTLRALHMALRSPPVELLWPGPFEGDFARGARGLLAASTGFGVGLAPTADQTLALTVIVAGDFAAHPEAVRFLELAWHDLAISDLGHLVGLGRPREAPQMFATPLGLVLSVALDPELLVDGLAAATVDNVREIMKGPPAQANDGSPPTE